MERTIPRISLLLLLLLALVACQREGAEEREPMGTPTASEDAFVWEGDLIAGLNEDYPHDRILVIPARAEGFTGPFLKGDTRVEKVWFESDRDIPIDRAFSEAPFLKQVILPAELRCIGEEAFRYALSLENLILPEKIERIEDRAFQNAADLKTMQIPDTVKEIGTQVWDGTPSLETLSLPGGLVKIGKNTVTGEALTDIYVPETVHLEAQAGPIETRPETKVHVVENSFMDKHFVGYFPQAEKKVRAQVSAAP